jgi:hypothetical protein
MRVQMAMCNILHTMPKMLGGIIEQLGPICPQEALFPRAYNLHIAFCDGLQNRKGLISPASHHGIHPAVCRVYEKEILFGYGFGYGSLVNQNGSFYTKFVSLYRSVSFWLWNWISITAFSLFQPSYMNFGATQGHWPVGIVPLNSITRSNGFFFVKQPCSTTTIPRSTAPAQRRPSVPF